MVEVVSQTYEQFTGCSFSEPECGLGAVSNFPDDRAVREGLKFMKSEALRLRSYIDWPAHLNQKPATLAKAGLFYTGKEDRVKCPFCLGVVKKWQPSDDPLTEHRLLFPHCGFILGHNVGNIPLLHFKAEPNQGIDTHRRKLSYRKYAVEIKPIEVVTKLSTDLKPLKQQGTATLKTSSATTDSQVLNTKSVKKDIDYSKEALRLESFKTWPACVCQTPESLAYAGFYHYPAEEKRDRVKCAYCQGKLYNWRDGDDPMVEHARCFPSCPYIKLCMGEELIDDLLHQHEHSNQVNEPENSDHIDNVECKPSAILSAVLEMGFPERLVMQIADKFSQDKLSDVTVSQMVDMLLETQNKTESRVASIAKTLKPLRVPGGQQTNEIATRHSEITSRWSGSVINGSGRDTAPTLPHDRYFEDTSLRSHMNKCVFLPCGHNTIFGQYYMSSRNCPDCGEALTGTIFM